jgi:peptidoglycan hydrolase CwlO-like protein
MNKKLNAFLRILTVVAAVAAVVFAFLLKGKMDAALTKTAWAVTDPEVKAGKEYDARMASLATLPALLDSKRKAIADLELAKKDLQADVADKKTKIEGLTAANTTLEGERAELTRKRDELAAQLTDANSKKDGAEAALATAKEELVRTTEKVAGMFTKEQVAESEAKATKAEETASRIREQYTKLHSKVSLAMENNPAPFGFPRDPLGEAPKPGDAPVTNVAAAVEAASDNVLTNILALDDKSGIVAFSVGEANGIKEKSVFDVKIAGKRVGKVVISSVKGAVSFGQLQPDKELDIAAISKAGAVSLVPSTKIASN